MIEHKNKYKNNFEMKLHKICVYIYVLGPRAHGPPPLGVGGSHPCQWPGLWDSLRNGLLPPRMVLEVIIEHSWPFRRFQMSLAGGTPLGFRASDAAVHSPWILQNH